MHPYLTRHAPGRRRPRWLVLAAVAACAMLASALAVHPAAAKARARPYILGDSVSAWATKALTRVLGRSAFVLDAAPCRGAVHSCHAPGQSVRPPSGLDTVRAKRGQLGTLVAIELGYNDGPGRGSIDRVMRELRAQGVKRVVWVNLSERRPTYHATNQALDAAARRWSELHILDWRRISASHDEWFVDGVHLTPAGKNAFALVLAQALGLLR